MLFLSQTERDVVIDMRSLACSADSPVLLVVPGLPVLTHQAHVTLPQVVPSAPAALPGRPGTHGTAAADPRGDAASALELQGAPGGAVYPLAGGAVQHLQPLSGGLHALRPHRPEKNARRDKH